MIKRGIRWAGVDFLAQHFHAGTPRSETHLVWLPFSGLLECDYGEGFKSLRPGEVAICPSPSRHCIRLVSPQASGFWIHFNPTRQWARLAAVPPGIYSDFALGHLRGLIDAYLLALPSRASRVLSARINAVELIIFSIEQAIDHIIGTKSHSFQGKIKMLEGLIQAELHADWTVAAMAAKLNMSSSYLYKESLRHLGSKPMGVVTKLRMNHAISRLLLTTMTLEAIAAEVGYASPYAFSVAFKREIGRSPVHFRDQGFMQSESPEMTPTGTTT